MFSCFNFSAYIRFFINVLIEIDVSISNELHFSGVYQSVNYIRSLAKFTWFQGSFTLYATQCCLHFNKPQKNEIHSLNIYILGVYTEKPYSKPLERNVVYIPRITLNHATSHDFK